MKYLEARDLIESGDLLVWSHKPWNSWHDFKVQMVRLFTRSEYSHTGTAYRMGGRVWVLEAVKPYPRMIPLSNVLPCYWMPLSASWKEETEKFALSLIGKQNAYYSELEAVYGFFGGVVPGKNDSWMCAEMTWVIANKDEITLGNKLTPSALVQAAFERGSKQFYLEE